MKYKHIVFDIDGTLLDSEQADLLALKRVIYNCKAKNMKYLNYALH